MSIFDQGRVGRLVRCNLVHAETGVELTGAVAWHLAIVGETTNRVLSGSGHRPGPWTVMAVDV